MFWRSFRGNILLEDGDADEDEELSEEDEDVLLLLLPPLDGSFLFGNALLI
jgi:hypothetical protein